MSFLGLPFSTLLAVFAAAGALTVLFYVLKLRRRPVAVAFARIWDSAFRDREATELFSRLRRLLSLLLQLALLAALVLALGDPRPTAALLQGRHLVVLVDASASMKAIDVQPSRIEVAKNEVRKLVRGLGSADRALIVQMGPLPSALSSMSSDLGELGPAIDRIHASDTRADFERALSFAADALRGLAKPEIVVVSDGRLGPLDPIRKRVDLGPAALRFIPIGKTGKNIAITAFSARRYPLDRSRSEVLLEVANTNDQPAEVELSLLGDGQVIDVSRFELEPNQRLPRVYADLAGVNHTLEARIRLADGARDDLPADDHAFALMPERRRARVLLVSPGNTYLEAALLLDEYLDVTALGPEKPLPDEHFDVAILDGVAPALPKGVRGALYLDPPKDASPVALGRAIHDFGFDSWDKKSPILRFLALEDVQVASGYALVPSPGDRVLGASELGPILVSGVRGGRRVVVLGFDPRSSDFVLRVAWPLFVLGTINDFVDEDTSYLSSFHTGQVFRIPVSSSLETATLIDPAGVRHSVPVKEGRAVFLGEQAGFYKLVSGTGSDAVASEFAANLSDFEESHITPRPSLVLAGGAIEPFQAGRPGLRLEVWVYLLAIVIALSLVEWFTYHRRVTV